jgi:NAD(P)-dependent dehydrogenase (short-subunit alcohol dehydrogenase family)
VADRVTTGEQRAAGQARRWPADLEGRSVVVTGASSGIGRAIAIAFGEAGARVLAAGRDSERLAETEAALRATPGECRTVAVDVVDPGAADATVAAALDAFGALDVVVPAAGVFSPDPFVETDLASLDRQFAVNVRAPYALLQAAIPHLVRARGAAVLISSISGIVGSAGCTAYCATKGAVELLTKSLALEVAPDGVRVNAVAPGNVHTAMNAHLFADPGYERAALDATPAGRIGHVDDIAGAVLFLASSHASYVNGATLVVDGGWTAA